MPEKFESFRHPYGQELVIDLRGCNPKLFTRDYIEKYFRSICHLIDMKLCEIHFWDDEGVGPQYQQTHPDTKGTSAVCFILTSSIVLHALDIRKEVYVNIFSCKSFDESVAEQATIHWFRAKEYNTKSIVRG